VKLNVLLFKFSKIIDEMRKPEITKKISTPTKPPLSLPGDA
jgi:hypothetical protein